jgi:hypothetical protein
MNPSINWPEALASSLILPDIPSQCKKRGVVLREKLVSQAALFPRGNSPSEQAFHATYFQDNKSQVGFLLPGKEAASDYNRCKHADGRKCNNPSDMLPAIFLNGQKQSEDFSFEAVFELLEDMRRADPLVLEVLGALFVRMALMVDHDIEASNGPLHLPHTACHFLQEVMPEIGGLPFESFLLLMDNLAWNEDCKYMGLGYELKTGTGRQNNMLTYANLICVLLGRTRISKFAGSFTRPPTGIAALPFTKSPELLPLLAGKVLEL